ncbi:MAG: hypothetical protein FIA97_03615 [Methylococcaceae bacterium]|nr:hypothetical protein [Methylococcaceae bacterium]
MFSHRNDVVSATNSRFGMARRWARVAGILAMGLWSCSGMAASKIALVIGNQSYGEQALKNAANDAKDMAAALKKVGFEVIHAQDADLRAMEEAVRRFGDGLKTSEVALFYYAGHGVQASGANYLIPVKQDIRSETDLKYKALDVGYVLDTMEESGSKLNIVILDACRNNPFRGLRGGSRGLQGMSGPTGSIIAFATAPNNVAEDGAGRNGVYTKYLLKNLDTPGLGVEEMFKRVRIGVSQETGGRQTPWENSSLSSDFCFAGCDKPADVEETRKSADMDRIQQENERLMSELNKMKAERETNLTRVEELRKIQQEKEQLERKIQDVDVDRTAQKDYEAKLSAIQREKAELEKALHDRDKSAEDRTASLAELARVGQEKQRLEQELRRYEQVEQMRQAQQEELDRLKKEKERLEQETKRFSALDKTRSSRIEELEKMKSDNERLLATLKEKDAELTESKAALREASKRGAPARREEYAPMIVNP